MRKIRHLDSQGRPVTDVELEKGLFDREVDEDAVARLGGNALTLTDEKPAAPAIRGYDVKGRSPYGPSQAGTAPLKQRSRLDFMRALSEEIKRRRRGKEE